MYHPKGGGAAGGGDAAAGGVPFTKLVQALVEQYELDIANARRHSRTQNQQTPQQSHSAIDLSESPLPVERVPESSIGFSLPNSFGQLASPHNAWQEEPVSPITTLTNDDASIITGAAFGDKSPGTILREQAHHCANSGPLLQRKNSHSPRFSAKDAGIPDVELKRKKTATTDLPIRDTAVTRFVRSSLFDRISAALLVGNAIFIGFQVEYSFTPEKYVSIDIVDYIFCVCFIIELCVRMWGFGCSHFWCDKEDRAWNIFDFSIVFLSTVDTIISILSQGADSPLGNISVLRVIRIVRITRVLRIIRVMKFFQDLRILVAAIAGTLKTASFALMLILFMMYMFGIAVTQMVAEHIQEERVKGVEHDSELLFFFGSIFYTIFTMFMTISGGIDWKDAAVPLMFVGPMALVFYLMYVALMVLCVMNVLTGMFCQSAIDTAASDRENVIQMQLNEKHRFVNTLQTMFDRMDDTGDGVLMREQFADHLALEDMQALLRSLEIEVRDAMTLFELLDTDGSGKIDTEEFVTGCITLRGGAKAVHMEKVSNMNKIFNARFDILEKKVDSVSEKIVKHHR
eukprot:TRINITY_DN15883_c0_g1_i1.p1 TRINITY_DN15883_c0_g1~~TRINITY_DN15883_c0_g1_i1.p1  ORF type:complete len:572 (-),score=144.68 TRINITY_DN15883_c0_g1_i1:145-1860(-)